MLEASPETHEQPLLAPAQQLELRRLRWLPLPEALHTSRLADVTEFMLLETWQLVTHRGPLQPATGHARLTPFFHYRRGVPRVIYE